MNQEDLIDKLRALPQQIANLTKDLSDEDLTSHYLMKDDGTPEWTVAQNVHHLADSHMNSYIRCKLMITEDNPMIRPYDQDAWAEQPEAKSADLTYSLAILHSLHNRWVHFWQNLEADDWSRTAVHPDSGPFTLDDQLKLYVDHGEGHIEQIQRTLKAKGL